MSSLDCPEVRQERDPMAHTCWLSVRWYAHAAHTCRLSVCWYAHAAHTCWLSVRWHVGSARCSVGILPVALSNPLFLPSSAGALRSPVESEGRLGYPLCTSPSAVLPNTEYAVCAPRPDRMSLWCCVRLGIVWGGPILLTPKRPCLSQSPDPALACASRCFGLA